MAIKVKEVPIKAYNSIGKVEQLLDNLYSLRRGTRA